MSRFTLRRAPLRVTTGAFILSAGLDKWKGDEQTAAGIHGFASGTYPFLKRIDPPKFLKLLAASEIAVGTALLLPVVPAAVAGAALAGFSAGSARPLRQDAGDAPRPVRPALDARGTADLEGRLDARRGPGAARRRPDREGLSRFTDAMLSAVPRPAAAQRV